MEDVSRKSFALDGVHSESGFTLMELLISVAIISLLSSVVLASISGARASARDAQRIQQVNQIQQALEMFYNDNGHYPKIKHVLTEESNDPEPNCGHNGRWCELENKLSPYIDNLPKDEPRDDTYYYMYYSSPGDNYQTYGVGAKLENNDDQAATDDGGFYPSSKNTDGFQFTAYEVGSMVSYCMSKYNGNDADWFWKRGTWSQVCEGGN